MLVLLTASVTVTRSLKVLPLILYRSSMTFLTGQPINNWSFPTRIFNAVSPVQFNLDYSLAKPFFSIVGMTFEHLLIPLLLVLV